MRITLFLVPETELKLINRNLDLIEDAPIAGKSRSSSRHLVHSFVNSYVSFMLF